METEADNTEEDCEDGKSHDLDRLTANYINGCNRGPVARDETGNRENQITNAVIVQPAF